MGRQLVVVAGGTGLEGGDSLAVHLSQTEDHQSEGNDAAEHKGQKTKPASHDSLAHPQQGSGPGKGLLHLGGVGGQSLNHPV